MIDNSTLAVFIIFCSILAIIYSVIKIIQIGIRSFRLKVINVLMTDYVVKYAFFQDVMYEDLEAEEIMRILDLGDNFVEIDCIRPMVYKNSAELRKIFIDVGELIIGFYDGMKKLYGDCMDQSDEYQDAINVLEKIRKYNMDLKKNK